MKQFYGASKSGDLSEAIKDLKSPKLLLLMSNPKQFEQHVAELEKAFPGVPSIGVVDMCYAREVVEEGVGVTAYTEGVEVATDVIEQVSIMPAKYIGRMERAIEKVQPGRNNTVCIDFCTGNDACVLTTLDNLLSRSGVKLMGGTGDAGKVSCNGKVYQDACAFALIRNQHGKVEVYKENIYRPKEENYRLVASKTDRSKYYIGELNGRPARDVYMELLQIQEKDIETQTFRNPFGKINGKDMCIVSIKEVQGNGLACFRQVNDSDVLTILEIRDFMQIADETISLIRRDFSSISGVFAVNCLFRYLYFGQNHAMDDYLRKMNGLNHYCGFVGYGEHYNNQFVNQSMTCVVFE